MSAENFTYKQLLVPPVISMAHFSFRLLPPELRTPTYDRRLLNGGANQSQPYSATSHLDTERWQSIQAVRERILSGETAAFIIISEAALRNFGGGNPEEDRHIQQEAIRYIADCATKGANVRVAPLSADTRGAVTDEFIVADFGPDDSRVVTYNLLGGTIHDDSRLVAQTKTNFEEIWESSLLKKDSIEYLRKMAVLSF